MKRSGVADLPLHGGRVPPWLADRMSKLGAAIVEVILQSYGRSEFLSRLSDPFWFQALGSVMGMDWHSSGITTSVLGALKRGLSNRSDELGIYFCGGRGKHSRRTPDELRNLAERKGLDGDALVRTSRLTAPITMQSRMVFRSISTFRFLSRHTTNPSPFCKNHWTPPGWGTPTSSRASSGSIGSCALSRTGAGRRQPSTPLWLTSMPFHPGLPAVPSSMIRGPTLNSWDYSKNSSGGLCPPALIDRATANNLLQSGKNSVQPYIACYSVYMKVGVYEPKVYGITS